MCAMYVISLDKRRLHSIAQGESRHKELSPFGYGSRQTTTTQAIPASAEQRERRKAARMEVECLEVRHSGGRLGVSVIVITHNWSVHYYNNHNFRCIR